MSKKGIIVSIVFLLIVLGTESCKKKKDPCKLYSEEFRIIERKLDIEQSVLNAFIKNRGEFMQNVQKEKRGMATQFLRCLDMIMFG